MLIPCIHYHFHVHMKSMTFHYSIPPKTTIVTAIFIFLQIYLVESVIIGSTQLYIDTDDVDLDSNTRVWFTIAFVDGGDYGLVAKVESIIVVQTVQL